MTLLPERPIHRLCVFTAAMVVMGLITGCDGQTDFGTTLRDFVVDFARSALAAFLL